MKELSPEQQQVVDKAAKDYASHSDLDCTGEFFNWTDQKEKKSFKAGVTFALSTPSLYMGLMEDVAEWVSLKGLYQEIDGKWYDRFGGKVRLVSENTTDLIKLFIEHKNKKEDGKST